ncbi:uncharacterized protein LOC123268953 [Cotesia glomerata]|uniref:uncharacterized protein LOC123268953 n=1 Tax=Cotesia glomerata TaxID=32391 RepID=UPI001D032ACA|nr:uncharacterized protein LOC123268953 [Cotesia glomerata]
MKENLDPTPAMIDEHRFIHKFSSITGDNDKSPEKPLKEIFTLPLDYLLKKKIIKIEKTGKSKLPSVGISDEWYKQLKKEKLKNMKEEKLKNKKYYKKKRKS